MSNQDPRGSSGSRSIFTNSYETRRIVIAEGLDFHESDRDERNQYYKNSTKFKNYREYSSFQYLEKKIGGEFRVDSDRKNAEYTSTKQKIHFQLQIVHTKSDFKTALETSGIIVVYDGHSRYGRGSCFDQYQESVNDHGDQWEDGTHKDNGLFRLGYPFLAVPFSEIDHHQYHFAPISAESAPPNREQQHPFSRHPDIRRSLSRIELPDELTHYVLEEHKSPSNTYFGFTSRGETKIILRAGWKNTRNSPNDLGATQINCKTFCHFGCSSQLHYWHIIRRSEYKGWQRTEPPTEKFAYFTTEVSDFRGTAYWLYYLLTYPEQNNFQSWWESHQFAKKRANRKLRFDRAPFLIY